MTSQRNTTGYFFKRTAFFILSCILFYIIFICIYGNFVNDAFKKNLHFQSFSYGYTHTRLSEAKQVKDIDVLFIGSSHTYRGFDTRIFNETKLSAFNLGTSSQTPIQTRLLLKRYLHSIRPKLIVYEVCPLILSVDGVESAIDIISYDKNDMQSIKMAFDLNNIKVFNTLIYGFYKNMVDSELSYIEPKQEYDKYIPGGYVERTITYYNTAEKSIQNQLWVWKKNQQDAFEDIIKLLQENNIQLLLIQSPVTKNLYNSFTNNRDFDAKMKQYGLYYNFNEIIHLNDSLHFYDTDHLNQKGVVLFNNELINRIIKTNK